MATGGSAIHLPNSAAKPNNATATCSATRAVEERIALECPNRANRDFAPTTTGSLGEFRMPAPATPAEVIATVRKSPGHRVKVAVSDIDGILRGKYIHKDKFVSAVEGGFGFCDVVFGWDSQDVCYDNTTLTGWHKGFPDALARLDLSTHRRVPWDDNVDFFLGEFVLQKNGREVPFPLDGRQVLKRVLKRAEKLGLKPMCGLEFEWFNFAETPQSWADKKGVGPTPITPGHVRLFAASRQSLARIFRRAVAETAAFGIPIEGLHTETGPGVLRSGDRIFRSARGRRSRDCCSRPRRKEIGARFGIMPSFMAKWSAQYPGCSGHMPPIAVRRQEERLPRCQRPRTSMSTRVRELSRGAASSICSSSRRCSGRRSTATSVWSTASGRRSSRHGASTTARRASASSRARLRRRGSKRAAPAPT